MLSDVTYYVITAKQKQINDMNESTKLEATFMIRTRIMRDIIKHNYDTSASKGYSPLIYTVNSMK